MEVNIGQISTSFIWVFISERNTWAHVVSILFNDKSGSLSANAYTAKLDNLPEALNTRCKEDAERDR